MNHVPAAILFVIVAVNFLLADAANNATMPLESIFMRFYNRDSSFIDIYAQNVSNVMSQINKNEPVVVYIPGYEESVEDDDVNMMAHAYLTYTKVNMFAVDYRQIATMAYPISVELAGDIGKIIADMLNSMANSGMDAKTLHILGHSLGAQVAAAVARNTNFRIPRITGLDPAGPLYYLNQAHLTASDADFVDIIHTDMGVYGLALALGHVDFYPNFGHRPQPGCPLIGVKDLSLCSHHRSYKYYTESIKTPNAFIGTKCESAIQYLGNMCSVNNLAVMGYATPNNTRGNYYLMTNAKSPFGRGKEGIKFSDSNLGPQDFPL